MRRTLFMLTIAALTLLPTALQARDGYDGRPMICDPAVMGGVRLEQCQKWIEGTMQPDNRAVSCCGTGDAYEADDFDVIGTNLYAIITKDYPGRVDYAEQPIPKGTRILIPPSKVNRAREDGGNPSGHGVVFMLPGTRIVLCYFGPTLS